jgi:hypothetical protein
MHGRRLTFGVVTLSLIACLMAGSTMAATSSTSKKKASASATAATKTKAAAATVPAVKPSPTAAGSSDKSASGDKSTASDKAPADPRLIEVAQSRRQWTGVAMSQDARLFVCFPRWSDDVPISVAEVKDGVQYAYPDATWNDWKPGQPPQNKFVCIQSVYVDTANRMWILDAASPKMAGAIKGGPKLIQVDLTTDKVGRIYPIDETIAPEKSYLNDVRIDSKDDTAFISDSGTGAIIAIDLATGLTRRLLADNPSTKAEDTPIVINGKKWLVNGVEPRINIDGLSLDDTERYLYYQALNGRTLYRIKTSALLDRYVEDLGSHVEKIGNSVICDGMKFGPDNLLYLTSVEDHSMKRVLGPGKWETVVDDPRLDWPDSITNGTDGYIYVTSSQIEQGPNPPTPYRIFKFRP